MTDPLAKAYLKVIEEKVSSGAVESTKTQVGKTFGDSESDKKAHTTAPKSSTEKIESEVEDAVEAPAELSTHGADGKLSTVKVSQEAKNPFDALYNKVLNEEMFDFSTEDNSLEPSDEMASEEETFDDMSEDSEEEAGEEITVTLDRELAQKLHDVLMAVLTTDEVESDGMESIEDLDEEGEEEEEEEVKEAVEAEYHGHPLVDQEKLEKGLTKPSNIEVKNAVPVSKKKAEVTKGPKATGEPEHCTDNPEELTQKSKIDTHGVKVGRAMFDQ